MSSFKIPQYIEGNNIFIQKISLKDAKDLYMQLKDPEIFRYLLIYPPKSLKEEKKFIKRARGNWKAQKEFTFTIKLKENSNFQRNSNTNLCGVITLWNINYIHNFGEIGIWIRKDLFGKGINYEAIQLILTFGFEIMNLERIEAKISSENISSFKSFEKMNFKLEGILRKKLKIKGIRQDIRIYSILKQDYRNKGK